MSNQQSTVEFGLRAVQFSRLTRRGILLGLSLPQLIVLAIGVLAIVGALYAGGGILLAWTAPVWLLSATLAWTPVGSRKLIEWVPVTFRWVARTQARQTVFRRRIEAAVQESGGSVDDLEKETLYDYYRSGESETFVLAALGCDESFN